LGELAAEGYVNDRKLMHDWARYRLQAKPLGRRRLAWELQRRGVDQELVEDILNEVYVEFDEMALAEQAARKRFRTTDLLPSAQARRQLTRYLLGLGFKPDTIATALAAISLGTEPFDVLDNADSI
jgi:regulatory protein